MLYQVKPKYMACVATAAYYIALQRTDIVEVNIYLV